MIGGGEEEELEEVTTWRKVASEAMARPVSVQEARRRGRRPARSTRRIEAAVARSWVPPTTAVHRPASREVPTDSNTDTVWGEEESTTIKTSITTTTCLTLKTMTLTPHQFWRRWR